ncbi:predicted protein [Uncinocarpus reesii 1704]|uniref:Uncharacterized protein n=1 Tax=Uncinocarpus reesii (strain UAMH 1704) TaxID=336963 RepID=C4JVK8_UNCRE|nr:uncharacterized protein UREG_06600 [Uncinocarpus reesii 1704]EEP81735.1 predicted protein [Uncinocarpus reesii 1704]
MSMVAVTPFVEGGVHPLQLTRALEKVAAMPQHRPDEKEDDTALLSEGYTESQEEKGKEKDSGYVPPWSTETPKVPVIFPGDDSEDMTLEYRQFFRNLAMKESIRMLLPKYGPNDGRYEGKPEQPKPSGPLKLSKELSDQLGESMKRMGILDHPELLASDSSDESTASKKRTPSSMLPHGKSSRKKDRQRNANDANVNIDIRLSLDHAFSALVQGAKQGADDSSKPVKSKAVFNVHEYIGPPKMGGLVATVGVAAAAFGFSLGAIFCRFA